MLNGRKIKLARFHQSVHIQGVGELGSQLPHATKALDLEMTYDTAGVLVKVRTQFSVANPTQRNIGPYQEAVIPWGNVVVASLAPEEVQFASKPPKDAA